MAAARTSPRQNRDGAISSRNLSATGSTASSQVLSKPMRAAIGSAAPTAIKKENNRERNSFRSRRSIVSLLQSGHKHFLERQRLRGNRFRRPRPDLFYDLWSIAVCDQLQLTALSLHMQ